MKPEQPLQRLRVFFASSILALRVSALLNVVLALVVFSLVYSLFEMRAQIHEWKPLVVRVDQVGNATPVDLMVENNPATELETKVFAADYITKIQSFNPNNVNQDIALALECTESACAKQLINYFNGDPTYAKLRAERQFVQCTVTIVQMIRATHTSTSPWELRVDYTLNNLATSETRPWFAMMTLKPTTRSFRNPFGLLVTGCLIDPAKQQ